MTASFRAGRLLVVPAVALASVLVSVPALADRYTSVTIQHSTRQPVTVVHTPVVTHQHVYTSVVQQHGPAVIYSTPAVVYGVPVVQVAPVVTTVHTTTYHPSFNGYYRGPAHLQQSRYNNHGHHNGHAKGHNNSRGSWSNGRQRDVVYVNRDGRRGSSYREVERTSVVIRERSR